MKFWLATRLAFAALLLSRGIVLGQGTAFTYQGSLLVGGQSSNGLFDMTFSLFTKNSGGAPAAGPLTNSATSVTNGLFTVLLDFGAPIYTSAPLWLEISVRANGGGPFITLNPRQQMTPAPFAINSENLSGTLAPGALNGAYSGQVMFTNPGNLFIGNGAGLTNIGPPISNSIPVLLSYSGTNVLVNAGLGTHFRLLATNNFLLQNPVGASDAQRLTFEIMQDPTGGRTMALGSAFRLGTDLPFINLSTNANLRDFMTCVCSGTNFFIMGFIKGY